MATLTVKQARAILGKEAQDASDADLERDIEVASMLKELFFENFKNDRTNLVKPRT